MKRLERGRGKYSLGIRSFGNKIERTRKKIKKMGRRESLQDVKDKIDKNEKKKMH
jgi:hypothetical protein